MEGRANASFLCDDTQHDIDRGVESTRQRIVPRMNSALSVIGQIVAPQTDHVTTFL